MMRRRKVEELLQDTTVSESSDEPLNLSAMAIADKVHRHIDARFCAAQLGALQTAVQRLGGTFVRGHTSAHLPYDVEEHLSIALILARDSYAAPKETPFELYRAAQRRLEDGFASALLRDFLAALQALGLCIQVRPEGFDREVLQAEQLQWRVASISAAPSFSGEVKTFVNGFFDSLK